MSSQIATPGIFEVFVVFEHPDGRTLGASICGMHKDLQADLVVFDGVTPEGATRYDDVSYAERTEGSKPIPRTWHY